MPRLVDGLEQVFSDLGIIGAGYKLFFFATTTTTPKTTYSNVGLTVANPNPVVCDASGRPEYDIWGADPSTYRVILGTPDSVLGNINPIVDVDPINNLNSGSIIAIDPLPAAYWGLTTGTSTAYVLNPALVPITSYTNKQCFFIDFHTANGVDPTLNVNTLGAVALKKYTGQGTKVPLQAGDIQAQRYVCINDGIDIVILNPTSPAVYLGTPVTLTVDTNAITITNQGSNYIIAAAGVSTNLNTISGGAASEKITIGIANNSNAIVLKNGVGNIINPSGIDITLSSVYDKAALLYDLTSTNWIITSVNAAGATPLQLLETQTAASSGNISFIAGINSAFSKYIVEFYDVVPASDGVYLRLQYSIDGGATYITTSYSGAILMTDTGAISAADNGPTNSISLTAVSGGYLVDNGATYGVNGKATINNPSGTANYKYTRFESVYQNNANVFCTASGGGVYTGSLTAINAIRFSFSSGNIAAGTFKLYGLV